MSDNENIRRGRYAVKGRKWTPLKFDPLSRFENRANTAAAAGYSDGWPRLFGQFIPLIELRQFGSARNTWTTRRWRWLLTFIHDPTQTNLELWIVDEIAYWEAIAYIIGIVRDEAASPIAIPQEGNA